MVVVDIVRLVIIFCGCVYASITDIVKGKIYNTVTFTMLLLGGIAVILETTYLGWSVSVKYLINVALVVLLSLLFYKSRIWAGGDTKLLCAIAALYPQKLYLTLGKVYFSLVYMIAIIFICGFLFTVIESVFLGFNKKNRKSIFNSKEYIVNSLLNYIKTVVYVATLAYLYETIISQYIRISNIEFSIFSVSLIFLMRKYRVFDYTILLIIAFLYDVIMTVFTGKLMLNTNMYSYLFIVGIMLVRSALNRYNYKEIQTDLVQANMILSRNTTFMFLKSKVKGLPGISDETLRSRITESEAESIKRWKNSKYGKETIIIVRKIPFAIFIFIGFIIYTFLGWYYK